LPRGITVPTTVVEGRPLPEGPIGHAIAIAEAINASGLGCATADLETGPSNGTPGNPAIEQVSCTVGDDTIAVSLFADHAALLSASSFISQASCFGASQKAKVPYVRGTNWIVFPERAATARRIAGAIGADASTIVC
jgi:hypothetical protein